MEEVERNMEKEKIYLDNCCFNRPYDDQSQLIINMETLAKLEIQQQIRDGKVDLATSYILVAENSANPFELKRNDIEKYIEQYTHTYVSEAKAPAVKELASEIMKSGIKLMDACHVACAILAGCQYFLTTDKRLLKYQTDQIRVGNPVTYLIEREEKNEH